MVNIFVEGSEGIFIKEFVRKNWPEKLPELTFISAGGKDGLPKLDNQFKENTDQGGVNLIIFDADSMANEGGFGKRKAELEKIIQTMGISANLFLLPNNQSDGDFETLLENIINPEHQHLMDCFSNYERCLVGLNNLGNNHQQYRTPVQKSKIFAFVDAFAKSKKEQDRIGKSGDWLFENPEFWDFDCPFLLPLQSFLEKNFPNS